MSDAHIEEIERAVDAIELAIDGMAVQQPARHQHQGALVVVEAEPAEHAQGRVDERDDRQDDKHAPTRWGPDRDGNRPQLRQNSQGSSVSLSNSDCKEM